MTLTLDLCPDIGQQMVHGNPDGFASLSEIMEGPVKECLAQSVDFPDDHEYGGKNKHRT